MKKLFMSAVLGLLSVLSSSTSFAKSTAVDICDGDSIFTAQDMGHKLQVDVCLEDEDTIYFVLNGMVTKLSDISNIEQSDFVFEGNPRNTSWLDGSTDLTVSSLIKFIDKINKEKYIISAGKNSEGEVYGFLYIYIKDKAPVRTVLDPKTIKSYILSLEDSNFPETE